MDETVKIRLVGALVLIALMAILWPLIFDNAEEIQLSQQSEIPAPPKVEEWQVTERELPAARVNNAEGAVVKLASPTASSSTPAESTSPERNSQPVTESEVTAATSVMRAAWAVKVASLNDLENGSRLVEKLQNDGYRAYGRVSSVDAGKDVMRVYIGPKFDKRRADSIKLEVDREYAVKSMVVPYQPDAV